MPKNGRKVGNIMTKFEQRGILFQQTSRTKEEAQSKFAHSCDVCCNRGLHIDCDRCGIAVCHKLTISILENKGE